MFVFDGSLIQPESILFGQGVFEQIGTIVKKQGKNPLVVMGEQALSRSPLTHLNEILAGQALHVSYYHVAQEPTPEIVEAGTALARANGCDCVLAIGGGSVMDTGKAIAAMATNDGHVVDYLEGVGIGRKIEKTPLPFIAVPTTAGTGSEATKNAVLSSSQGKYKKSLRSDHMVAKVAVVDPLLTLSVPPMQTAYSGMDALTQLIEAYISRKANPITDALALAGIEKVGQYLLRAYQNGQDVLAREEVMLGALYSGICLSNAGLGAVHGIAAALGAHVGIPHGLACAVLLPLVLEINLPACEEKLANVGEILAGQAFSTNMEAAKAGILFIKELNHQMSIPKDFKAWGIGKEQCSILARDSFSSSMSGNPVQLSQQEWTEKISQWI